MFCLFWSLWISRHILGSAKFLQKASWCFGTHYAESVDTLGGVLPLIGLNCVPPNNMFKFCLLIPVNVTLLLGLSQFEQVNMESRWRRAADWRPYQEIEIWTDRTRRCRGRDWSPTAAGGPSAIASTSRSWERKAASPLSLQRGLELPFSPEAMFIDF